MFCSCLPPCNLTPVIDLIGFKNYSRSVPNYAIFFQPFRCCLISSICTYIELYRQYVHVDTVLLATICSPASFHFTRHCQNSRGIAPILVAGHVGAKLYQVSEHNGCEVGIKKVRTLPEHCNFAIRIWSRV